MNRHMLGGLVATTMLWPAVAAAQTTVIETTGAAPPDEVVTYVQRERVPLRVDAKSRWARPFPTRSSCAPSRATTPTVTPW